MNILQPIIRGQFLSIIPKAASILEIGPYCVPAFSRPEYNVFYADIVTAEQIREQFQNDKSPYGHTDLSRLPDKIDILISPEDRPTFKTDLKFDCIYSSHNIEHHPDLITHLREMASVAKDSSTKFFLAIPDKRYCFDYYQAPSLISEMIGAHWDGIRRQRYQTFLQTELFRTHNTPGEHWQNIHGENPYENEITDEYLTKVKDIMRQARELEHKYVDTHSWRFTPKSFAHNIELLYRLELQPWRPMAVFETNYGSNEFYAVLEL